jgi:DNA-binding GntR family transcriptional regulator
MARGSTSRRRRLPSELLQFKSLFEVRVHVEELVGRLAAQRVHDTELEELDRILDAGQTALAKKDFREITRLDWRYHSVIGEATRNPMLAHLALQLLVPFNRPWYVAMTEFGQVGDPSETGGTFSMR